MTEVNLQGLFNYCTGMNDEGYVELTVHHPLGANKRKVRIFPSLAEPLGIFVGNNQRGDGAVVRVQVGDVRVAARAIKAGLLETAEIV